MVKKTIPEMPRFETRLRRNSAGDTHVGRKRKGNEDSFFIDDDVGLYVVADGMGGHAAGEIASSETTEVMYSMVKRGLPELGPMVGILDPETQRRAERLMESAVQAATYMVYSIAELELEKSGMGTTVSAMLITGEYAITAQVGDSRIYRVRGEHVEQLTEDHTLVNWQIKEGLITPAEAAYSPHRNVITRAVGNRDYVEVDTNVLPLSPGDRFLLCSDGLHGYLHDEDVVDVMRLGGAQAVAEFIRLANERGGKDNITAVTIEIL